jgi:hypothetical protein
MTQFFVSHMFSPRFNVGRVRALRGNPATSPERTLRGAIEIYIKMHGTDGDVVRELTKCMALDDDLGYSVIACQTWKDAQAIAATLQTQMELSGVTMVSRGPQVTACFKDEPHGVE